MEPIPGPEFGGTGWMAAADPGSKSDRRIETAWASQTRCRTRTITGRRAGNLVATSRLVAGCRGTFAKPAGRAPRTGCPVGRRTRLAARLAARSTRSAKLARLVAGADRPANGPQSGRGGRADQAGAQATAGIVENI